MSDGVIVRCRSCGQANRVPTLSSGKAAVCGKCKAVLDPSQATAGVPVALTDAGFAQVIGEGRPVVVDFWAAWCGPCRTIAPVIEELARARTDITFAKLDVDANPRTSAQFNVSSIPTLVFFRDGKEAGRLTGAVPRPRIEQAIRQYLG